MSKFDPHRHHRHSIRLKGYDYASAGAYFVTTVTWQRQCLFGEIVNHEIMLNRYGEIVEKWWDEIPIHFPGVETGAFVIMPNHIHGLILITPRRGTVPVPNDNPMPNDILMPKKNDANEISHENNVSSNIQGGETPPRQSTFQGVPTLGQIIAYFKYQSTKEMNLLDNIGTATKFWQRNYYERIIRDETALHNITRYIEANPLAWEEDQENPLRKK